MTHITIDSTLYHKMHYPVGLHLKDNITIIDHYTFIIKKEMEINNWTPHQMCLVCRGSSGAIIAGIIGYKIGINVYHVKKPNESSHYVSAPSIREEITIVVDDFISSGDTIQAICKQYNRLYMLIVTGEIWADLPVINKFQKIYVGKYTEYPKEDRESQDRKISYERSTAETL